MIKSLIALFVKFYLFWLIFFASGRIMFLALYRDQWSGFTFGEVLKSLTAGFRLDLSTISYFGLLLALLLIIQLVLSWAFKKKNTGVKLYYYFTLVLIITSAFINAGEAGLYTEWGAKLNAKALSHMLDPTEVVGTVSPYQLLLFVVFSGLQILLFGWLFKRVFMHRPYFQLSDSNRRKTGLRLVGLGFTLLPMVFLLRGGLQPIPINISDANYSRHIILNDVAINSDWNLVNSIRQNRLNLIKNPYQFMSDEEAKNTAHGLIQKQNGAYPKITSHNNPNIVMLILESWSADLVEELGGMQDITPHFGSLIDEGYLFTNFYANGWTSDQGICALLSASPVFPHTSVINQSDKSRKISSINQVLRKDGYSTSFHFGGQMSYGNIKAYLLNQNFDILVEQQDLGHLPTGRLGIHDEYMYDEFANHLNKMNPPFFSALFTVSTHSPYDIPQSITLDYTGEYDGYLKSAKYADNCMRTFFERVRQEPWYDNTLFVIVADHSHKSPISHTGEKTSEDHKIPLLFYGPALSDSLIGKTNNTLGSQLDILHTLLDSWDKDMSDFQWSKNLMDPKVASYAPYVFHYGIGMIAPQGEYSYIQDRGVSRIGWGTSPESSLRVKHNCEAYFQTTNAEFMDL